MRSALGSKRFLTAALAAVVLMGVAATAGAKCGDNPGDLDAVAATRSDVNSMCDCSTAINHGAYVACARGVVQSAVSNQTLPPQCTSMVMRCARKSTCGRKPGFVPCCRTDRHGVTRCSIKSDIPRCQPPPGGSACFSRFAKSCCDSCTSNGCILPTSTPTPTPRPTPTPPGFCKSLLGLPTLGHVPVSLLPGTTDCGGLGFSPPPQPPLTGQVNDAGGAKLADLGLGCLYTGTLPPTKLSSGSSSTLDIVGLNLPTVVLGGSDGTGPLDCTKGSGPDKHCANGKPGTDGNGLCTADADCGGLGTCLLDPNCYFGPPVPVPGDFPGCAVNALLEDMCGSMNLSTMETSFYVSLSSRIYLTFDNDSPCPQCVNGLCTAGKNVDLPCTPLGNYNTSPDCPPRDNQFVAALQVVVPQLTTGTSTLTADANGRFCDEQPHVGAFTLPNASEIVQQGQGLQINGFSGETTAVGTFCIYKTGNPVIDYSGDFPAPGTLSARSSIGLLDVLLP